MNYSEMIKSLYKLGKKGSKLDLKRITTACTHFNNPQNNLKIIHIAGTNGKGSVAAMLDSILREAGYSVGLYTSPHLIDFRERIQINREKIPKEDFLRLFEKINQANLDITFFEFTTLLALLYFQEKQPDYVILEVGLGGRLDATNICSPILSVITNISIDHQEYLGNTLESITKEKCGIIKIVPVFTCQQEPIILDTIKKACSDKRLPLTITNDYKERISLLGDFQKQNAGLAESVARSLELTDEKISQGLKHVSWPGRIDYLEPQLLVDGAHNASGIKALSNYVSSLNKNIIIIFGVSEGKNHKEIRRKTF